MPFVLYGKHNAPGDDQPQPILAYTNGRKHLFIIEDAVRRGAVTVEDNGVTIQLTGPVVFDTEADVEAYAMKAGFRRPTTAVEVAAATDQKTSLTVYSKAVAGKVIEYTGDTSPKPAPVDAEVVK